jgi:hypothetical protein
VGFLILISLATINSMRIHYWTCSSFADWLRGTKKPFCLGWDDWDDWHKKAKSAHPVRYYLAEDFLRTLQNIVYFPSDCVRRLRFWIYNRFVSKTHYLKTGLKPGCYHELDERIIHGLFNELNDFVEIELASLQASGDKKYNFRRGRCPAAGLDHLEWASSLVYGKDMGVNKKDPLFGTPTPQAEASRTIRQLYDWWKERPNRIEPYSIEDPKKSLQMEEKYYKEDDRMLAKLIKVRRSLWT